MAVGGGGMQESGKEDGDEGTEMRSTHPGVRPPLPTPSTPRKKLPVSKEGDGPSHRVHWPLLSSRSPFPNLPSAVSAPAPAGILSP